MMISILAAAAITAGTTSTDILLATVVPIEGTLSME
jgi:hypothetical protein